MLRLGLLTFFHAAPAPAPGYFFKRLRLQGAKNTVPTGSGSPASPAFIIGILYIFILYSYILYFYSTFLPTSILKNALFT